ncbi:MAG: flagellar biosynthesis protein FlgD [Clostridia bacterium]|nr:flagellar biosynthesis protein FlgD [Clostridia bacterium]
MATSSVSNQKTIDQMISESAKKPVDRKTGEMGKSEFLNLLVTQLKHQDPLNPVDDKEFIAQMAQFSALEQMQNMNTSITQSQAYSLMGKQIRAEYVDENTRETVVVEGEVTGVKTNAGKAYVIVKDREIPVEKVSEVFESSAGRAASISQHTNLIGYNASGSVYDSKTGDKVQVTGAVKSIRKGKYENVAVMDGVKVEASEIANVVPSTDPDFMKNYLENNKGKEISLVIKDSVTGNKVTVKGILDGSQSAVRNADGSYFAVLNSVEVPVDSIDNVSPPSHQPSVEAFILNEILKKLESQTGASNRGSSSGTEEQTNEDKAVTDQP